MPKAKMLEGLRIYRDGDGKHVVEHESDPPETHRFGSKLQMVKHVLEHVDRLKPPEGMIEEQEGSQPDSYMGGRSASFAYGSARTSEIRGR